MKVEKLQACCSSFLSSPYILVSELKKYFKIKYLKLFYWKSYLCWCICLSLVGLNFCFFKTWIIMAEPNYHQTSFIVSFCWSHSRKQIWSVYSLVRTRVAQGFRIQLRSDILVAIWSNNQLSNNHKLHRKEYICRQSGCN